MHPTDILDNFEFDDELYLGGDENGEVVARFYSLMEAEVAAARLRSEGIPCFLANIVSMTMTPHLQPIARLHVRPADMNAAREVLALAAIDYEPEPAERPIQWKEVFWVIFAVAAGLALAFFWVQTRYKRL